VIIAQRACALLDKKSKKPAVKVTDCKNCEKCMKLGCPAISKGEKGVVINPAQCVGCGVCMQVCPFGCIQKEGE
jgi:indolepyruvate ferredoxin oxidoreductase alpha subunit